VWIWLQHDFVARLSARWKLPIAPGKVHAAHPRGLRAIAAAETGLEDNLIAATAGALGLLKLAPVFGWGQKYGKAEKKVMSSCFKVFLSHCICVKG